MTAVDNTYVYYICIPPERKNIFSVDFYQKKFGHPWYSGIEHSDHLTHTNNH